MPTKRPDQLPEGEDFNFEDILMVEKNADSESRKLHKAKLREFMRSALKMDPERLGENAILGMQSKFDWLIEQMEKISQSPILDVEDYDNFDSESKKKEESLVTPTPTVTTSIQITPTSTPTPTPTITPTITPSNRDPNAPIPSPSVTPSITSTPSITPSFTPSVTLTPTPTISTKPLERYLQVQIEGRQDVVFSLPEQYKPDKFGYSNWRIKPGQDTDYVFTNYFGFFPDNFTPSGLKERLLSFVKVDDENLRIEVGLIDTDNKLISSQGLIRSSVITFTIIYS